MNILILGGTGLIGTALAHKLAKNHTVRILSRNANQYQAHFTNPSIKIDTWDGSIPTLIPFIEESNCVINLVGENIANSYWTPKQKEKLYTSRIALGAILCSAMELASKRPTTYIQASAIGYYPLEIDTTQAVVSTEDTPNGHSFLATLAVAWEASTAPIEMLGVRRCCIRTSPVLANNGGMLTNILPPFKWYMGGYPRTGKQPFPWIHIEDEVRAIEFLIENAHTQGAYNLIAPEIVSVKTFCETLARELHKPCLFPIPQWILRMALGELAEELVLAGQKAMPKKLCAEGFVFSYPTVQEALHNILAT